MSSLDNLTIIASSNEFCASCGGGNCGGASTSSSWTVDIRCLPALLGVVGALPVCERERTEREECVEDGCEGVVRWRRGVDGPAPGVGARGRGSAASRAAATSARREDARGVAEEGKGFTGEESLRRLEGVAVTSNSSSSSSSSGIGPSNATLRLCVGVLVGVRPTLGARSADLVGDRLTEREGTGMGGGRIAAETFVGDTGIAAAGGGFAVYVPVLIAAISSCMLFETSLHTSWSASVSSSNWSRGIAYLSASVGGLTFLFCHSHVTPNRQARYKRRTNALP